MWEQAGSTNYMYEYKIATSLCPDKRTDLSQTVSNPEPSSQWSTLNQVSPLVDPLYYDTIGGLFDEIQDAITYGADRLTVTI